MILVVLVLGVVAGTVAIVLVRSNTTQQPTQISQESPAPTQATSLAQKDETVNWKTYKGKYFSLKYPPNWTDNTGPATTYPNNLEVIGLRISPEAVFEISAKNLSYKESVGGIKSQFNPKMQNIILDNRSATRFDYGGSGAAIYPITSIVVEGESDTKSFLIVFNGSRNDISEILIAQILSTFKFLD